MPLDHVPEAPPAVEQPFDLGRLAKAPAAMDLHAVHARCPQGKPGEIVVCAPDQEKDRLHPPVGDYAQDETTLPKAEVGLGGGASLGVTVDSAPMPNGVVSNRAMANLKFKL